MVCFTKKQVVELSRKYNVIPVYREILSDLETPMSAYLKIDNPEYSFLLESVEGGENTARYSFLSRKPAGIIRYENGRIYSAIDGKKEEFETSDPLGYMSGIFKKYKAAPVEGLPARGGAVGYIGYDIAKLYNKVPSGVKKDDLKWPDMFFMLTGVMMIFDHVYHKIKVMSCIFVRDGDKKKDIEAKYEKAVKTIDSIIRNIKKPFVPAAGEKRARRPLIRHHVKKEDFKEQVRKTVELIKNGEAIQVVLSQRFSAPYEGDPVNIYRCLRAVNPSPYMHFIRMGKKVIIGASPEVMIKVENRKAMVRPIAGTAKRGKTAEEDAVLEKKLLSDEKERAEHVMLIDLGRNDIGKVSKTGSVKIQDLMAVEKYSHVMHMVSNVTGMLSSGKDALDAFAAAFPAGTVSGAPKVRAMQIIEEMEKTKRGPYSGAVGYISYGGVLDTCISLRTIYYDGNNKKAYMQAGAGIVADSNPEYEYKESLNKAEAVFKALRMAVERDEL